VYVLCVLGVKSTVCLLQRGSAHSGCRWRHHVPETRGDRLPAAAVVSGVCVSVCVSQWLTTQPVCVCFRCATHRGGTSRWGFTARCSTRWPDSTTRPTCSTSPSCPTATPPTSSPWPMEVHRHTLKKETHTYTKQTDTQNRHTQTLTYTQSNTHSIKHTHTYSLTLSHTKKNHTHSITRTHTITHSHTHWQHSTFHFVTSTLKWWTYK